MIDLLRSLKKAKNLQRVIVIDCGGSSTKAVYLERRGTEVVLLNYVIRPAPTQAVKDSVELMAEFLREIQQALGAKSRQVIIALSPSEGVFRNVELPELRVGDLRNLLKNNSRQYLHRELEGFEIDCAVISRVAATSSTTLTGLSSYGESGAGAGKAVARLNVLVGAANGALVDLFHQAALAAGLIPAEVTFTQSGLINCARMTCGPLLADNAVALIDIGSRSTAITILLRGEAMLTRIIPIGGDHLTAGLAREFGISLEMAEELKVNMSDKDLTKLEKLSQPLLDELRASIDFFEQLHERIVSQALITGGAARGEATIRLVQEGLVVPRCQMWNLGEAVRLGMPEAVRANYDKDASRLGSALALGETVLLGEEKRINLLTERQEAEEERRRDPVKRSGQLAAALVALMCVWGLLVQWEIYLANKELTHVEAELVTIRKQAAGVTAMAQKAAMIERQRLRLNRQSASRFLWTGPLNALQYAGAEGVEVVSLQLEESLTTIPATKPMVSGDRTIPGRPAAVLHKMSLQISARDAGEPPAAEKFIESLAGQDYFKERLRKEDPVLLRERMPQQLDPLNGTNRFIPFSIECVFKEWRTYDD